jgi:peptide/nickel transport system substrate-binding protein
VVAAGGASLLAASVAACGGKSSRSSSGTSTSSGSGRQASAGTPKPGGTFVTLPMSGMQNPPLDPQKVSAAPQYAVGGVYSRVFRFKTGLDPNVFLDHTVEPDLGMSAESPDAITWTVKLRQDAKFTNTAPVNGHAVEAEDVKATFIRALDPATASPNRGQLNMLDSSQITTPDKQTVVFKLNYAYAPFRNLLASPAYSLILPREVQAGMYDPGKTVIGSGPFMLESATPDVAYVYKRNPDWFGKPGPYIDGYKIAAIPDPSAQKAQFAVGALDELVIPTVFDVQTVQQQNPKATVYKISGAGPDPLYFQMGDPSSPFKDIRLRRAISMLVDRDAISKAVYNGQSALVVYVSAYMGRWSLPVDKLDADTQQYYKYNPSEAKKLLDAAGQSNLAVRLVNPFASLNSPTNAKAVEVINQSFNSNGVKSQIVNGDYNKDFVDAGHGWRQGYFPPDMVIYGAQAGYSEADDWLFSYFHSKSTSNQEHLNDPTYDAMIDKERTLVNDDDRVKAIYDIQKYLAQQMYAPCTGGTFIFVARQDRVQNYNFSNSLGNGTETYAKLWLSA